LGRQDADSGHIRWGANLNIGYYDQRLDEFDPDSTVYEEVAEGRDARDQDIRNVLGTMLFRGDDIYKPVGLLSGGERARVRLSQLLLDAPNVMVLDEPTNHLDIPSREALEGALATFPGTVLCVSHDRYFLDRMARRLFILTPPNLIDFPDTYSAWVRRHYPDYCIETPPGHTGSFAPRRPLGYRAARFVARFFWDALRLQSVAIGADFAYACGYAYATLTGTDGVR